MRFRIKFVADDGNDYVIFVIVDEDNLKIVRLIFENKFYIIKICIY